MADASMSEEEIRAEQTQAEVRRQQARREAERGDRLAKAQADRLAAQPEELRQEHKRLRIRQRQIDDYHNAQRHTAEAAVRERQAEEAADAREAEIRDAQSRYAQALADYDIRDPYGSLAQASMTEYASFRRDREDLSRQIAAESDPAKRRSLELRQEIERCDYMSITSHRIAGQSEMIVGRSNTVEAVRQREQAREYEVRALELRAQYREQIAEQELGQDVESERTSEPEQTQAPAAPVPRQRGPRTARGRAERGSERQTEAGDAEAGKPTERRRAQRGDPAREGPAQDRQPGLER